MLLLLSLLPVLALVWAVFVMAHPRRETTPVTVVALLAGLAFGLLFSGLALFIVAAPPALAAAALPRCHAGDGLRPVPVVLALLGLAGTGYWLWLALLVANDAASAI
ncbi:hypothetical protein ACI799_20845 [Blastococcus sp. SYSU DS0753]